MARVPHVTRTIQTTHCAVLCMDIENREPCNKDVVLPRTYKDDNAMLKAVKKVIETDTIKPVQIVASEVRETLYGMTEQEFIAHARILPPRKGNTTNGENDDIYDDDTEYTNEG